MAKRGFLADSDARCRFVGCLHLLPLPGSAGWAGGMAAVRERALAEAQIYADAGADGLILENTHDVPYLRAQAEPATIAAMAAVAAKIRDEHPLLPIGIQVLAAADLAALEIAVACDLDFVRVEGFAYAHVADEGVIQGNAGRLLRRRAHLLASHVEVWADIKKKHSAHALTADLSLSEFAKGALFCQADGLIVTGDATGEPPAIESLQAVSGLAGRLVVGSGVNLQNIAEFARLANVLIVGSECKEGGDWRGAVARNRVRALLRRLAEKSQ